MSEAPIFYLAYDTPIGEVDGVVKRRVGRQSCTPAHYYTAQIVQRTADYLCGMYGEGTHWVEDEGGNRIDG